MRAFGTIAAASCTALLAACPGDFDVEGKTFPCRSAADCVEGYECHSTRFVCVIAGTADGGALAVADSGISGGARIGDRCSATGACDEGFCVDAYCCATACTEECFRCDQTPGQCLPVADNTDPDAECAGREYDCSSYTAGLTGTSCFAGVAKTVNSGTCSGRGACRPVDCALENGALLSSCENPGCLREDACPEGAPITAYDSAEELCASGRTATCGLSSGNNGCCSATGACCPGETCTPGPLCE